MRSDAKLSAGLKRSWLRGGTCPLLPPLPLDLLVMLEVVEQAPVTRYWKLRLYKLGICPRLFLPLIVDDFLERGEGGEGRGGEGRGGEGRGGEGRGGEGRGGEGRGGEGRGREGGREGRGGEGRGGREEGNEGGREGGRGRERERGRGRGRERE